MKPRKLTKKRSRQLLPSLYSNILWRGAANRIPDRKKPGPDRQDPPHRLCQQVG